MSVAAAHPESSATPVGISAALASNLAALSERSPAVARAVQAAQGLSDLRWTQTDQPGAWSAELGGRALASRRRPLEEAEKLALSVDFKQSATAAVLGFGLGYHVAALVRRGGSRSLVLVFEPDVDLLRSVMERADFGPWIRGGNVRFLTDPDDAAAINEAIRGVEGLLGIGVQIVEHPASAPRLGERSARFAQTLTKVVAANRMQLVTTMVQMETTLRNLLMNADHYAASDGVGPLAGAAAGRPAVVVSAGPSLERNVRLLLDPAARSRVVVIAVQTVLKPLLALGIRPDFVTAIDFHEISRRFYEGLDADDVRGVTLVAEPKCNAAILEAWPGPLRLAGSDLLDMLLGDELAGEHAELQPGATVAHLAYYLARYMGCDPVILIGQDLAFTDGQYYSANAAIHGVWSGELNEFNTLEMMEWQRIVRWRGHLSRVTDHLGRPVYTDDQMSTYLAQFERDFMVDAGRGLTTIDATEGGARKAHTRTMTLAAALGSFACPGAAEIAGLPPAPRRQAPKKRLRERLERLRLDVMKIADLSRRAADVLERMARESDVSRVNALVDDVHDLKRKVERLTPAYQLVLRMNQAGAYRRFRADRALALEEELDPVARQKRQIERDGANVRWIAEAADALGALLNAALASLSGGPKLTRDLAEKREPEADARARAGGGAEAGSGAGRVEAVILADSARSGVGAPRDLGADFQGASVLRATLQRLARTPGLSGAVLITDDAARARALAGRPIDGLPLRVMEVPRAELRAGRAGIERGRLWARACWRGGLGSLTCYDEALEPALALRALEEAGADAALVVGADWCLVDPELCGEVVARYLENPEKHSLTFSQAAPGLAGCVVSAKLCEALAKGREAGDIGATLGGLLGFRPTRPRLDPVALASCVQVDEAVRGAEERIIADGPARLAMLRAALAGADAASLSAAEVARRVRAWRTLHAPAAPEELELRLVEGGVMMDEALARRAVRELAALRDDAAVTLTGEPEVMLHPAWSRIVGEAREAGIAGVHVRTRLWADEAGLAELAACGAAVVSVDLLASKAATYEALTGRASFDACLRATEALLGARRIERGVPATWVVPRITRRDAVYEEIEAFFDRGLLFAGACVIDPLERPEAGARIGPLALPAGYAWRRATTRLVLDARGEGPGGVSLRGRSLADVWSAWIAAQGAAVLGAGGADAERAA
ncbi:MAG: 6-hydroxymethylpterin diphosphokinase MptE-like protein [Planctomycetota bacterium]|nr:6-hydroxymethylpterin diphosphokinase MptE-like protein [Planctomycetota bacterium]